MAYIAVGAQKGSSQRPCFRTKEVANYATFKLFMHLLPLIPDEENLKKFREVTHCVKMADDIMPYDVLTVIAQEDKLRTTTVMTIMNDTLGKLFADFAAPGAAAGSGSKKTVKSSIMSDAVLGKGSVFGAMNIRVTPNTLEFNQQTWWGSTTSRRSKNLRVPSTGNSSHSTPSFTTGLIKACLERFVTHAYKDKTYRTAPPPPMLVPGFVIAERKTATEIRNRVKCFQKLPVWRHGKNHATFDLSYQIRLAGLPFFSEEAIFYASAAQAICEAANPEIAPKYLIDHSKAIVNMALHGDHFGMTMHCHKKRPAFSAPSCNHMFRELELSGENLKSDRGPQFS
ncbi:hypothetical protein HPB47_012695 [Ixodes persulcatus]|uniref:Uncharacterized protein n=1 Tax=Ixodes persulcatus TaxID=34615 RepID=A0AC60NST1_IXOPE|nr:hypothetical protein HPB47_012695 [Ixodes persulcatus]